MINTYDTFGFIFFQLNTKTLTIQINVKFHKNFYTINILKVVSKISSYYVSKNSKNLKSA